MDGTNFYTSSAWRKVRERKIAESGGICCRCGRVFNDTSQLIVHHKQHLKGTDYNDPNKAFNDDNLEVICMDCHNKEHDRFKTKKHVYIVYGAPFSGKTTFVRENKEKDDLVVNLDELFRAITLNEMYDKPDCLKYNVFMLRDSLFDQIKMRYPKSGGWRNAWIIGGYSNKFDLESIRKRVNADECILVDTSREECLKRLDACKDFRSKQKALRKQYIEDRFKEYTPPKFF